MLAAIANHKEDSSRKDLVPHPSSIESLENQMLSSHPMSFRIVRNAEPPRIVSPGRFAVIDNSRVLLYLLQKCHFLRVREGTRDYLIKIHAAGHGLAGVVPTVPDHLVRSPISMLIDELTYSPSRYVINR